MADVELMGRKQPQIVLLVMLGRIGIASVGERPLKYADGR